MSQAWGIYGKIEFPPKKIAAWREAEIEDVKYAVGLPFERTRVADVLDEAASFGQGNGQFVDIKTTPTSIAIEACLVDEQFFERVKPIVAAFCEAARFGGEGELRVSELPGQPDVFTMLKSKVTMKRTTPRGDDDLQRALFVRASDITKKHGRKKKK